MKLPLHNMEVVSPTPENIARAIDVLRNGGTVVHATETCYGIACDLQNQKAVENLFMQKERPEDMPVSALFESIEQAKIYVEWNELADQLAHEHLPGPLTLVIGMKHESGLFPTPTGGETLGIRIPPHPIATELVKAFGTPISTTSANVHSQPNTYSPEEILSQFEGRELQPTLILDSGILEENDSSSVVDVTGDSIEILRPGSLNF